MVQMNRDTWHDVGQTIKTLKYVKNGELRGKKGKKITFCWLLEREREGEKKREKNLNFSLRSMEFR